MRRLIVAALIVAAAGSVALAQRGRRVGAAEEGKRAFLDVHRVLLSPRCMNCHPQGDRPLQGDQSQPHAQNVSRASEAAGLKCTTCHRGENHATVGGPPGVPNWHMPSAKTPMVFQGLSPSELCRRLKDPAQNGGKGAADLVKHVEEDALVKWGWSPGPGRTPPPIPHADFVRAMKLWTTAGQPCP